ncbi:MAG: hypothetical protein ACAI35_07090, partial [Candidatus Methylacidiphilales bacterium]
VGADDAVKDPGAGAEDPGACCRGSDGGNPGGSPGGREAAAGTAGAFSPCRAVAASVLFSMGQIGGD